MPLKSTNIVDPRIQRMFDKIGKDAIEYFLQNVIGDGGCGFRCIALHCCHDETQLRKIRKDTNKYLIHHCELL